MKWPQIDDPSQIFKNTTEKFTLEQKNQDYYYVRRPESAVFMAQRIMMKKRKSRLSRNN